MNYLLEQFGRIFQSLSLAESGDLGAAKSLLNGFTTPDGTTAEQGCEGETFCCKKSSVMISEPKKEAGRNTEAHQ